ncbi:MAG: hypothetical protein K2Q45_06845 [Nitrosomonas sp.]|nr:hypothetical protein [Nitrosomonas sp.]
MSIFRDFSGVVVPNRGTDSFNVAVPTPGFSWDGSNPSGMAAQLAARASNKSNGSISLKNFDQLQYVYLCPPLNDGSDLKIMPEQLVFTVNEMDLETNTTLVLSIPKLNMLMQQQWDDFVMATTGDSRTNVHYYDEESHDFFSALKVYGERALEAYHNARVHSDLDNGRAEQRMREEAAVAQSKKQIRLSLQEFYQKSTEPGFCYLTRHGILSRISYAGVVINTNHAVSLQELDRTEYTDHFTQVNVAFAKRTRVTNVFGTSEQIVTGSKLWLELTRKLCSDGKYGAFVIKPNGARTRYRPRANDIAYIDESGTLCDGHYWIVGKVLEPSPKDPQPYALENANGTGKTISERVAIDVFGTLPSMYVALGFGR